MSPPERISSVVEDGVACMLLRMPSDLQLSCLLRRLRSSQSAGQELETESKSSVAQSQPHVSCSHNTARISQN
jgi:hypothetical protein